MVPVPAGLPSLYHDVQRGGNEFLQCCIASAVPAEPADCEITPKTKSNTHPLEAPVKKMKTESDASEKDKGLDDSEGEVHSDFEVHQVFQRLPAHILREIQGCLDFVEATKKCRVSKSWKLVDNPLLRKGMVLLELPRDADYRYRSELDDKLVSITPSANSWTESMPIMKAVRIRHMVIMGSSSDYMYSFVVSTISPDLSKVTYCNQDFGSDYDCWTELPTSVKSIALVNCTINFYQCDLCLDRENQFWQSNLCQSTRRIFATKCIRVVPKGHGAHWRWKLTIPQLVMDRSLIPFHEDSDYDESENDDQPSLKVTLARALDARGLIWPYPKEQLNWLLTSLDKLDEEVLEVVKDADEKWQAEREKWKKPWEPLLDQLKVTTAASSDGRRLTSLDLAFFGRFLVSLAKVRPLANFQSPPFAFPAEFNIIVKQFHP